jgi:transposase-like protein
MTSSWQERVVVTEELPDEVQRWTAKRRSALILSIVKGETTMQEAARKHGLSMAEIEDWKEKFFLGAENALHPKPRGKEALKDEQIKRVEPTPRGRGSSAPSREPRSVSVHLKGALVLGVVVAVFGAGCGGGGKLGVKALSQESKSLQSLAAEGALLAEDAVFGKTTHVYTREHSSDLYKAASQAEALLKTAKIAPALEPTLNQLAVLAAQVRADLNRLGGASKEDERAIGRELQAAAQESQKISEELK